MSSLPWTLSAEIFPLKERSLCVGIATSVNWVANFIVAFALGMTLFVITLCLNIFALYIVRKYREQYE